MRFAFDRVLRCGTVASRSCPPPHSDSWTLSASGVRYVKDDVSASYVPYDKNGNPQNEKACEVMESLPIRFGRE